MARISLALAVPVLLGLSPASAGAQEPVVYPSAPLTIDGSREYTLDVSCPAGTVVLGGGWQAGSFLAASMSSDPSKAATDNAWHLWGQNVDEFSQQITGVTSCATTEAFPEGSLQYPAPVTTSLAPWPAKSHISLVGVGCPSGYVPIAGGFKSEEDNGLPGTQVGLSYPTWALEKNTTGNSWVVAAENFENYLEAHFETWEMSSVATCVNASLAFGVFQLNANSERQEVEEPTVTTAPCGAGDVISGGFAAFEKEGGETIFSGPLEAMYFNSTHSGFSVLYSSGHVDHHLLLATAFCADISPATANLDQAGFDAACQAAMPGESGVRAVAGPSATDWSCAGEDGSTTPIPGNQGAWACGALGQQAPTATFLRMGDPESWVCYGLPSGAQPASKVQGSATSGAPPAKGGKAATRRRPAGARVSVSGRTKVRRPVGNLGLARVTVPAMLLEASRRGDLLQGGKGRPVNPVALEARGRRGRDFVYAGGSKPRITLRLRLAKNRKAYRFRLSARGGKLVKPRLCDSGRRPTTHLTTRFTIETGGRHPTDVLARSFWKCGAKSLKTARPALRLP